MNHPAPMPALRSATRMRHPSPRLQPGFFAMRAARTHRRPRRSRRTRPAAGKSPRSPTPEKPIRPRGNPSEPREAPARPASPTLSVAPGPCARQRNGSPHRTPPTIPDPRHRPSQSTGLTRTGEPPYAAPPCHTAPAPLQPLRPPRNSASPAPENRPAAGNLSAPTVSTRRNTLPCDPFRSRKRALTFADKLLLAEIRTSGNPNLRIHEKFRHRHRLLFGEGVANGH